VNAVQVFPAPAKLNLSLLVTGRRADGYHLLQTVFRFIDFADAVRIGVRTDGRIERLVDLPGVPVDDDLTVRAARLLQRAAGTALGADIALDKRLPLGGGLGGGSSDAATVLLALNRLWGLHWPRARLQALALTLGADVPVFVFGRSALATGIGEQLSPLALPPAWYLVLIPPVAVTTARIFQDADLIRDSIPLTIPPFSPGAGRNDLEPVVCRHYPEVAQHLAWLGQHGVARMSGSGACVFAEFGSEAAARAVLGRLPGNMRGVVARGLDHHPLWSAGVEDAAQD
jgi:4-diphosphocytidyl-2-C-methyl-D-erythritol kinase